MLKRTVSLSTHNICFDWEIQKIQLHTLIWGPVYIITHWVPAFWEHDPTPIILYKLGENSHHVISLIWTHLACTCIANAKKLCYVTQKSQLWKCNIADVIYHCKMMSVMALDGVTLFWRLKDVTNTVHVNKCETVQLLHDFFSAMAETWMKLKTSNVLSLFIACSNQNRSALVRELVSNNSLFVSQLYEDKSLKLRARDLIFFTTDIQIVNYYSTIHC